MDPEQKPVESTFRKDVYNANHSHMYSSYLLGLQNNWAYAGRGKTPGRTKWERNVIRMSQGFRVAQYGR